MPSETNLIPSHDHVIVEPETAPGRSKGGILIPESAREKPQKGTVLAVGPGRMKDDGTRTTMTVKPGDLVLFGRYAGSEIEDDGRELRILREGEILRVYRPKDKL
jgi:chaperonin GroES